MILSKEDLVVPSISDLPQANYQKVYPTWKKMQAIAQECENADRDPTEAESRKFSELDKQLRSIGLRQVPPAQPSGGVPETGPRLCEGVELWQTPKGQPVYALGGRHKLSDWYRQRLPDGIKESDLRFGRAVRSLITGDWSGAEAEQRIMAASTTSNTSGGYLISTPLAQQFIDLARANSVMVKAGARTVPMESSTLTIARCSADPSVEVHAENATMTDDGPTFEAVVLTAYTLSCFCTASRELAEDAEDFPQVLESILSKALAAEWDKQCLRGSGSAQILGIVNCPGTNSITGVASPEWDDLLNAMKLNEIDNCYGTNAYVCSPTCMYSLLILKTGDGTNSAKNYMAPPEKVERLQALSTTAIADANMVVRDFRQAIMGIRQEILFEASREGKYFEKHQVGFKTTIRGDMALRIPDHFCVLSGIS